MVYTTCYSWPSATLRRSWGCRSVTSYDTQRGPQQGVVRWKAKRRIILMSDTSDTVETAFASVAAELQPLGATRSAMFGMPCLKIGTKAFAGLAAQAMVFKLPADARTQALQLDGAHQCDPMGGRPMKEWIAVPRRHAAQWSDLAASALAYVAGAPARPARR